MSVATGTKLVFVAGQVARDAGGGRAGEGDYAAQVEQCSLNVGIVLAEVGASFDDVAKLTVYVVELTPDKMPLFVEGAARAVAKLGVTAFPPLTGVGVAALAEPDMLAEVEATAVVDSTQDDDPSPTAQEGRSGRSGGEPSLLTPRSPPPGCADRAPPPPGPVRCRWLPTAH
ncbi:RidA family protein [Nocardiopsis ansamitocini]|uniref:RidA family protein n=1 Tax=Nocardiopsis ansamitocini TaxID=1670832 RepID=UPI0032DA9E23